MDELQYTVNENEGSIEICTEMIGSLTNNDIQVHLSTADHTAVGMLYRQQLLYILLYLSYIIAVQFCIIAIKLYNFVT